VGEVIAPRVEGSVGLGNGRRLGFAEFGPPRGRSIVWLHGTPGARRQIPAEARAFAEANDLRIVGIDRPGIGSSTPHLYENILAFADDLELVADRLGLDELAVIGLSGGGPYALAAGAALPDRVTAVGVLGGVAPTVGPDAIDGGLVSLGRRLSPVISVGRVPIGIGLTATIRVVRPLASRALDLFARVSPDGDRALLERPEFKAMFLDDLLNGSRKQFSAPLADVLLFSKDWGFRASDVTVPVRWWHGDADHIIPFAHGEHMVRRLPDAELRVLHGESHLAGLGVGAEILTTLTDLQDAPVIRATVTTLPHERRRRRAAPG
jgi:pimeloyl-ACP methyl ester carboxylesterase